MTPPAGHSVSVIIPTYNSGQMVTQALESVLAQTFPASEIIVVDDGSTDDSSRSLQPFLGRIRYISQHNQGASAARNRGIQECQGDLIAFLDADDFWHPRKLELQMHVLSRRPEVGLLGTSTFEWPTSTIPTIDRSPLESTVPMRWEQFVLKTLLYPSTVVTRRSVLQEAGGFDIGLRCSEDRDLWLRIAELSQVAKLDLPLTGYRFVPGSLSQQLDALKDGGEKLLRKLDERRAWKGRRLLRRKAYSFFNYQCSYEYSAKGNQGGALVSLLKSFAWYPLPYGPVEVGGSLVRLKRLGVFLLRMLRLKSQERHASNHSMNNGCQFTKQKFAKP